MPGSRRSSRSSRPASPARRSSSCSTSPVWWSWRDADGPLEREAAVDLLSGSLASVRGVAGRARLRARATAGWCSRPDPQLISFEVAEDLVDDGGLIARYLDGGGWVAWGAIPTDGPIGDSGELPWRRLAAVWCELTRRGCDPVLLRTRARRSPPRAASSATARRRRPGRCGSRARSPTGCTTRPSRPGSPSAPDVRRRDRARRPGCPDRSVTCDAMVPPDDAPTEPAGCPTRRARGADRAPQRALLRARRARDQRRRLRRARARAARARRGAPRARRPRARRSTIPAVPPRRRSRRSVTSCRCSRSTTRSAARSSSPGASGSTGSSRAPRSSPSRRWTASRSRCSTATAGSRSARRAATA